MRSFRIAKTSYEDNTIKTIYQKLEYI